MVGLTRLLFVFVLRTGLFAYQPTVDDRTVIARFHICLKSEIDGDASSLPFHQVGSYRKSKKEHLRRIRHLLKHIYSHLLVYFICIFLPCIQTHVFLVFFYASTPRFITVLSRGSATCLRLGGGATRSGPCKVYPPQKWKSPRI